MSNGEIKNTNAISSIRYYRLTDENAKTFYDEWRLKTMAIIRKKGWYRPFEHPEEEIPTSTPGADATDEQKELFKSNEEAYDQVLMGCSGVPLGSSAEQEAMCGWPLSCWMRSLQRRTRAT